MNRLVVALDGSNTSEVALGWAVELASLASATITVVIVDQGPAATGAGRAQELVAFALRICGRAGVTATASVSLGDPTEVLVEQSESLDAGLVVVGAPGPRSQTSGEKRHLSDEPACHIDRPLALIPATARPGVRRIIVGVGRGPTTGTAIQAAADLAPLVGADVVAVHALCPPSPHGEGGGAGRCSSTDRWTDARRLLTSGRTAPLRDAGVLAGSRVVDALDVPSALRRVSRQLGSDLTVVGCRSEGFAGAGRTGGVSRAVICGLWGPVLQVPSVCRAAPQASSRGVYL